MDIKNVLTTMEPPRKRRRRQDEIPIWAQRAPRAKGEPPTIPPYALKFRTSNEWSAHGGIPDTLPHRSVSVDRSREPSVPSTAIPPATAQTLLQHMDPTAIQVQLVNSRKEDNDSFTPPIPPVPEVPETAHVSTHFSLNEEPSITGFIPYEETTKVVCDFLYEHVVARTGIDVTGIGETSHSGAVLEIEAKLGRIIDRDRRERLRLPVVTECVLSRDRREYPYRLTFESSMTVQQHSVLNHFLNETLKLSHQPDINRKPLTYVHRKHRDVFYDLPRSQLPALLDIHTQRHHPKVRVTYDEKTGAVVARIIKCRVADLDVYSPRTQLDWRLSVNIEMEYTGSLNDLNLSKENAGMDNGDGQGYRIKDRVSYLHNNAYQIDLTQVQDTRKDASPPIPNFEHELEVELSSAEVRRLGELAREGDPANQYERLIKGFVDNVRVLSRKLNS